MRGSGKMTKKKDSAFLTIQLEMFILDTFTREKNTDRDEEFLKMAIPMPESG